MAIWSDSERLPNIGIRQRRVFGALATVRRLSRLFQMSRISLCGLLAIAFNVHAEIPAAPLLTLYKFNGPDKIPYYQVIPTGIGAVAGYLSQGSSVVPCLVIQRGKPLTDESGTPFVGFQIVVDSATATPESTSQFIDALAKQQSTKVTNHHCPVGAKFVINVRDLYPLTKQPWFDPPFSNTTLETRTAGSKIVQIVKKFHNSRECASVGQSLTGRRDRLAQAWESFIRQESKKPEQLLTDIQDYHRAKHFDYALRTALFEGHLDRGCSAYGACERNVIVLSIRNRAAEQCLPRQGCRFPGDFQGVSSNPSQYNIWDNYLTQISGLTSCYLRDDLKTSADYFRLQHMFDQNAPDAERILYSPQELSKVFPGTSLADLSELRHYYHPPAMGKCFPQEDRVEYVTGAVAQNNGQFALIANSRIKVGTRLATGYHFKEFRFEQTPDGDAISTPDSFSNFVIDPRKITLSTNRSCTPFGVSPSCQFAHPKRFRTTPSWLSAGEPIRLHCHIRDIGPSCSGNSQMTNVELGGSCDPEMMPVSKVR